MDTVAGSPFRALGMEELARYREDGVIMVKGAVSADWLRLLEAGLASAREKPSLLGRFQSRKTSGYAMDTFLWLRSDEIRDALYYGPFAHWARQLMGSEEVRFFYDQMFVKEPGSDAPTPWHQDLSFWPVRGQQITSMWIPFDRVSRESSGLMYVRGSHKWAQRYKAISPDYVAAIIDEDMADVPDINADPGRYELLDWDMEPGDILMFHPLTLHGSHGNTHRTRRRRALALRFTGDDARYAPSKRRMPILYPHTSRAGGPLEGAAFPRLLPTFDPAERRQRRTPIAPRPEKLVEAGLHNLVSSLTLKLRGVDVTRLQQTWDRPADESRPEQASLRSAPSDR